MNHGERAMCRFKYYASWGKVSLATLFMLPLRLDGRFVQSHLSEPYQRANNMGPTAATDKLRVM